MLPLEVKNYLLPVLKSDSFFAQVATSNLEGLSAVRTVHVKFFEKENLFYFACSKKSNKWDHLQENPKISGCYFDQDNLQIRWFAGVALVDNAKHPMLMSVWEKTNRQIKQEYWRHYSSASIEEVCPDFGIVSFLPHTWIIYKINDDDKYDASVTQFKLKEKTWLETKQSFVDGL